MADQFINLIRQVSAADWAELPETVKRLIETLTAIASLSEREDRLLQFLDATPVGIAIYDQSGRIIYLNQLGHALVGVERPLELSPEELSSVFKVYREGTRSLYPPQELPSARAMAGVMAWADDLQVYRDDTVLSLEVKATPIFDQQGNVVYAVATLQDISDRKRQQLEQQTIDNMRLAETQQYRQVVQIQKDFILHSSADATITFANDALCEALGQPPDQVVGQSWARLIPPQTLDEVYLKIAALTPAQPTFEIINQNYRPSGQLGWTEWRNFGIFDHQEKLIAIQSVGRDVTVLQQQIQREKSLNQVFQAIRNSLDLATIFATATAETSRLFPDLDSFVVQYFPEQEIWRHVAEHQQAAEAATTLGLEIPDADNPFAARLKQFQVVQVDDTAALNDHINRDIAHTLPGAWLLVPLVVEATLWGSLSLISAGAERPWLTEEIELVQAIAHQLEMAIQQANLYQQMQAELAERRRVEAALRESETRFQNIAANLPGTLLRYILRTDGSSSVLYISQGCRSLWEVEPEQVVSENCILWDMIHPEDVEPMQASILASAQTLQPWSHAWRIITPSGTQKWLEAAGRPTRSPSGDVIWDTLVLDVSERVRLDAERQRAEQRFQTIVANMPGVLFQYALHADGSEVMQYISPGCLDLFELSAQTIEADINSLWAIIDPQDVPILRASVVQSAETLQPSYTREWRVNTPSGRRRWLQGMSHPQKQTNGDIVWDGIILDISDRKRAEAATQQENAFRQQILDNMVEGLCVCQATETFPFVRFTVWNPQMVTITGYSLEEINCLGWYQRLYPDPAQQQQAIERMARMRQGENLLAEEWTIQRKDGQPRIVEISTSLIGNEGQDPYVLALIQDITERKQTQSQLIARENQFRSIFDHAAVGIVYSPIGCINETLRNCNPRFCDMLGYSADELAQLTVIDITHPEDRDIADLPRLLAGEIPHFSLEKRYLRKDGTVLWANTTVSLMTDTQGKPLNTVVVVEDISDRVRLNLERKQAEAALRDSESRYRLVADSMNDLVCLHDPDGNYLYISPSCEALIGYSAAEMFERDPYFFFHPEDRERVRRTSHLPTLSGKSAPITYRARHKAGHYIWFETLTKPILDDAGNVVQIQTTSRDVNARIQAQAQLRHDALHDQLTGLPNRSLLVERLNLAIHRAQQMASFQFAVLFLDLDRFKVINDSLGHLAGDRLLITVAHKLRAMLNPTDVAARLGGDEFIILLEEIEGIQTPIHIAERIFAELRSPVVLEGREVYITASIGLVLSDARYTKAADLIRDADIAMYRAKQSGKARFAIFDTKMHTLAMARLHLENDLRQAIDRNQFVLHYQPIVALETGALVGFEALMRWQHPIDGLKNPGDFIPIAEETGLITQLDAWGLQTACSQLAAWQQNFPRWRHLKISVNLSAQDLRQQQLANQVERVLAETGLSPDCLTLEITESMLIDDVASTIDLLSYLKQLGVQISIDDFGTGYSSLSYLHRLPIDTLKVDRSFVIQMETEAKNQQIVATIAALSQQLGFDAIAEGIETHTQLKGLQQLGYRYGQGHLFARALAPNEVATLLSR